MKTAKLSFALGRVCANIWDSQKMFSNSKNSNFLLIFLVEKNKNWGTQKQKLMLIIIKKLFPKTTPCAKWKCLIDTSKTSFNLISQFHVSCLACRSNWVAWKFKIFHPFPPFPHRKTTHKFLWFSLKEFLDLEQSSTKNNNENHSNSARKKFPIPSRKQNEFDILVSFIIIYCSLTHTEEYSGYLWKRPKLRHRKEKKRKKWKK